MMKQKPLIETNPFLKDPTMRKALIARSVESSYAVESIKLSKVEKIHIAIQNRIERK